jgi:hypothetical protein
MQNAKMLRLRIMIIRKLQMIPSSNRDLVAELSNPFQSDLMAVFNNFNKITPMYLLFLVLGFFSKFIKLKQA